MTSPSEYRYERMCGLVLLHDAHEYRADGGGYYDCPGVPKKTRSSLHRPRWTILPTSCKCGGKWAWFRQEDYWAVAECMGCVCHSIYTSILRIAMDLPPLKDVVVSVQLKAPGE